MRQRITTRPTLSFTRSALLSSRDCLKLTNSSPNSQTNSTALSAPSFFGFEARDFLVEHGDHLGTSEFRNLGVIASLVLEELNIAFFLISTATCTR